MWTAPGFSRVASLTAFLIISGIVEGFLTEVVHFVTDLNISQTSIIW